jgi:hypothetical protein
MLHCLTTTSVISMFAGGFSMSMQNDASTLYVDRAREGQESNPLHRRPSFLFDIS